MEPTEGWGLYRDREGWYTYRVEWRYSNAVYTLLVGALVALAATWPFWTEGGHIVEALGAGVAVGAILTGFNFVKVRVKVVE